MLIPALSFTSVKNEDTGPKTGLLMLSPILPNQDLMTVLAFPERES